MTDDGLMPLAPGHHLNIKTVFPGMGISIIKIWWWWDRIILIMGIPILVKWHLYPETGPGHWPLNELDIKIMPLLSQYYHNHMLVSFELDSHKLNAIQWVNSLFGSERVKQPYCLGCINACRVDMILFISIIKIKNIYTQYHDHPRYVKLQTYYHIHVYYVCVCNQHCVCW